MSLINQINIQFFYGLITGGLFCSVILMFFIKRLLAANQDTFKVMATEILDHTSEKVKQTSLHEINHSLAPLGEKIKDFKELVQTTYNSETRERFALKREIEKMEEASHKMTHETQSLAEALKGNVKVQGDWGEMVLEKVLNLSGLSKGREYITQGQSLGLKDESGSSFKPDVIINLPEGKHVVIDSKVSLKSYEQMYQNDKSSESIKLFIKSIRSHIDGLSKKNYSKLEGLNCVDFVFMFIPIQGAITYAIESDSSLMEYAWKKNVIICGPSGLMANLKTINHLWSITKQNRNAKEIAKRGGLLYDKFILLYEDLTKLGESMNKSQDLYTQTLGKLSDGKGNLVSKAKELKELGVKHSKDSDFIQ